MSVVSKIAPEWEAKYLKDIESGKIIYPRIESIYGPMVPYSDEIRDLCYEIWAFQAARNCAQTERLLWYMIRERPYLVEELQLNHAEELRVTTIRGWAKKDNWEARANMELASVMPEIRRVAYRELGLAVLPAIQALSEISNDRDKSHASANAVRLKAAQILLDRAGYGPRFDIEAPRTKLSELSEVDVRKMTMDQLLALDAQIIDRDTTE